MRKFVERWWPLISLPIFLFVLFVAWCDTCRTSDFYCRGESSCAREWLAALSGYVAILAAAWTLKAMNQQREEANKHQKENVELTIMSRLATARALATEVGVAIDLLRQVKTQYDVMCKTKPGWPWCPDHHHLVSLAEMLISTLSAPAFSTYEREIGLPWKVETEIQRFRKAVAASRARQRFEVERPSAAIPLEISGQFIELPYSIAIPSASVILKFIESNTAEFLEKWEHRLKQ